MKKWMLISLSLLLSIVLTHAIADEKVNYTCGDWVYTLQVDGTAEVTEYLGTETHITFPSVLDDYAVTSVGSLFFAHNCAITEISFPSTITHLNDLAMAAIYTLEVVNFDDGTITFGDGVFTECPNIQKFNVSATHPHLKVINDALIDTATQTYIKYPNAAGHTAATIPEGILHIDRCAFYMCTNLTSIVIPDGVTHIGRSAFSGCTALTKLELPDTVTQIGERAFAYDNLLAEINIPSSLTHLGKQAFWYCSSLEEIILPNSLLVIEDEAFAYCESLTSVILSNNLEKIGSKAFESCDNLAGSVLYFPNTLTEISSNAFSYPKTMRFCVEPGSYAEQWARNNGYHIADITRTFISNDYLYERTCISAGGIDQTYTEIISYLGTDTELIIPAELDGFPVTQIRSYAFYNSNDLTSVTLPDTIIGIDPYTFSRCENLTTVHLPDSLYIIFDHAFAGCVKLSDIEIPATVYQIGSYAFYNCTSLASIILPEKISSIGDYAFAHCSSLSSVTFPKGFLTRLFYGGKGIFNNCSADASIYIYRNDDMEAFCQNLGIPYFYVD